MKSLAVEVTLLRQLIHESNAVEKLVDINSRIIEHLPRTDETMQIVKEFCTLMISMLETYS